jgi:hypothetical protein
MLPEIEARCLKGIGGIALPWKTCSECCSKCPELHILWYETGDTTVLPTVAQDARISLLAAPHLEAANDAES